MKLRARQGGTGDAFDGLTAEDVRRIRGGAAVSVTPGLEGLAGETTKVERPDPSMVMPGTYGGKRKKGRR